MATDSSFQVNASTGGGAVFDALKQSSSDLVQGVALGIDSTGDVTYVSTGNPLPVTGTVHGSSVSVSGGSLTVHGSSVSVSGGAVTVHGSSVTVANSSGASAVPIRDGGNSLTVDGAVTVHGSSVSVSGGAVTVHGSSVTVANSSGGSAVPIRDGGNSLTVDGAVTVHGSSVSISSGTVDASGSTVTIGNSTGAGAVPIKDGGNSITVDGAVTVHGSSVTVASGSVTVHGSSVSISGGQAAHNAPVSGNPVAIAGRANLNEPSTQTGDGDATYLWLDRFGRAVTVNGHPNPETPATVNATTAGDKAVIAAPGAGVSLHVKKLTISNASTSAPIEVALQENGSTADVFKALLATGGGGIANVDFGDRGWKLTANTGLDVNLGAAGDVHVNVTDHYIAA